METQPQSRLNRNVVLKALKLAKRTLEDSKIKSDSWDAHLIGEQISFLEGEYPNAFQMITRLGGNWLGELREWIKCKAINGCDVTWGSEEPLKFRGPITVAEVERIAARAASSGAAEALGMKQSTHF